MTALTVPQRKNALLHIPRVDTRLVTGLVLVAVSVIGGIRLMAAADNTLPVLQAAHDLPANHVLAPGDVKVARVHVSKDVVKTLVRSSSPNELVGRALTASLSKNGLLPASAITRVPKNGREITIPIDSSHALGETVQVGDRVDVLASFDKGNADARTLTVVSNASVVALSKSNGLFGQSGDSIRSATLAIAPNDAVYVAFAVRNAEVDIIRTTGAPKSSRDSFSFEELQ